MNARIIKDLKEFDGMYPHTLVRFYGEDVMFLNRTQENGYDLVHYQCSDGIQGWAEAKKFLPPTETVPGNITKKLDK